MPETLFKTWTGLELDRFKVRHSVLVNGVLLRCFPFNLDLMRVQAGRPTEQVVSRLQTDRGIVVPEESEARFPRMPVLGVRTLCFNRITFTLNVARHAFALTQPRRAT